jgi:hypothetical protein
LGWNTCRTAKNDVNGNLWHGVFQKHIQCESVSWVLHHIFAKAKERQMTIDFFPKNGKWHWGNRSALHAFCYFVCFDCVIGGYFYFLHLHESMKMITNLLDKNEEDSKESSQFFLVVWWFCEYGRPRILR